MAALTRLISQAHCHVIRPSSLHISLCSSSPSLPSDPTQTNETKPQPTPIQPVSYAVKPKEPSTRPDPFQHPLSREDVRFVRDFNINPIFYWQKVAPLPGDKSGENDGVDLKAERRKIEEENRVMRCVFRGQELEKNIKLVSYCNVVNPEKKMLTHFWVFGFYEDGSGNY